MAPKKERQHRKKRKQSIFRRVVSMFILVMVLDGALLVTLMSLGGVFNRMHENALNILAEATKNKYQTLENQMVSSSDLDELSGDLDACVAGYLEENNRAYAGIAGDAALNAELIKACAPLVLSYIRAMNATGLFIVLDGMGVPGVPESRAGIYVRDADPANSSGSNNDLSLLRGLPPVSRELDIPLDSYWQAAFTFDGGENSMRGAYFDKPLAAYRAAGGGQPRYFGYWNGCFSLDDKTNLSVFTYSRPLVNSAGEAYGVVGVELESAYIASMINGGEYGGGAGNRCYFLGRSLDGGNTYEHVVSAGVRFRQNFGDNESLTPENSFTSGTDVFLDLTAGRSGKRFTGAVCELSLYSPNTAFVNERWALIGLEDNESLFALEKSTVEILRLVIALGLALGVFIAIFAAGRISRPFMELLRQLRRQQGTNTRLAPSGLAEADALADTIVDLNGRIREDASRISKIITLSGMPIGVFERRGDQNIVFCSDSLFELLGCQELRQESGSMPVEVFDGLIDKRLLPVEEDHEVFLVRDGQGARYLRLRQQRDKDRLLGTLIDVTSEVENRRRIEHERDYDVLTNLLNRRAFEKQISDMFLEEKERIKPVSALVMIDMDNLKTMNDMYGHDCGDQYIHAFAKGLEHMRGERCLMARRSGDEFYLFYYGYASRDEIRTIVINGWRRLLEECFILPDGTSARMRASAGVAWYPDDARSFARLLHFADFAMYRVKNTAKGTVEEFSKSDYNQAGYLFNGSDALNRLLDEQLVRYAYQPIVSAIDGGVMGYELLMRPQVKELTSPGAVLSLSKTQGKLFRIEYLTWFKGLESAAQMRESGLIQENELLFINSIASQMLRPEDEERLRQKYGYLFGNLVTEITEGEQDDRNCLSHKMAMIRLYNGRVAIDDLGSGYNSEASLISIDADYVKIDLGLVRDVDQDGDKYALVKSLADYAIQHNIAVIAEGVETPEEIETLCALGVDYYQGYYVGRPAFEPKGPDQEIVAVIRALARKYGRI